MAKDVEVMVMVSQLQLDEGTYRKGSIISLPPEKIMSLGNSVAVVQKPAEEKPPKRAVIVEDTATMYEDEEPPKKKPKSRK